MRNEAKYMVKRPVVSSETRLRLTKDDVDLRVTICHIRDDQFRTGAHKFSDFVLLTLPLKGQTRS
jgi:hypothetical protein